MCGGECNNLGHYMVSCDGQKFEDVDTSVTLITSDDVSVKNTGFELPHNIRISAEIQVGIVNCNYLKEFFGISNNWRKMHGFPKYRKMR